MIWGWHWKYSYFWILSNHSTYFSEVTSMAPLLWSPRAALRVCWVGTQGERQTVGLMDKEPTAWFSREGLTCLVWDKCKLQPECITCSNRHCMIKMVLNIMACVLFFICFLCVGGGLSHYILPFYYQWGLQQYSSFKSRSTMLWNKM